MKRRTIDTFGRSIRFGNARQAAGEFGSNNNSAIASLARLRAAFSGIRWLLPSYKLRQPAVHSDDLSASSPLPLSSGRLFGKHCNINGRLVNSIWRMAVWQTVRH